MKGRRMCQPLYVQLCVCGSYIWNIGDALTTQYPLGLVAAPGCVTVRAPAEGFSPAVSLPAAAPEHSHRRGAAPSSVRYPCVFQKTKRSINMQTVD